MRKHKHKKSRQPPSELLKQILGREPGLPMPMPPKPWTVTPDGNVTIRGEAGPLWKKYKRKRNEPTDEPTD